MTSTIMHHPPKLQDLFEGNKYQKVILTIAVVAFLLIELIVYLASAGHAGQQSRVIVRDTNGTKIYETAGSALSSYEKIIFENNYGPIRNYSVQLESEVVPFPFRAWVSAAVGIPVGLVLMIAFLVKAYLALLYGDSRQEPEESAEVKTARFGSLFGLVNSFSIFHFGFLAFVAVLLVWMVPNLIGDFAQGALWAIREYQWFFLGVSVFLAAMAMWMVYLRYRLSKQMLENQMNIEKFKLEQQMLLYGRETPVLLSSSQETSVPGSEQV